MVNNGYNGKQEGNKRQTKSALPLRSLPWLAAPAFFFLFLQTRRMKCSVQKNGDHREQIDNRLGHQVLQHEVRPVSSLASR